MVVECVDGQVGELNSPIIARQAVFDDEMCTRIVAFERGEESAHAQSASAAHRFACFCRCGARFVDFVGDFDRRLHASDIVAPRRKWLDFIVDGNDRLALKTRRQIVEWNEIFRSIDVGGPFFGFDDEQCAIERFVLCGQIGALLGCADGAYKCKVIRQTESVVYGFERDESRTAAARNRLRRRIGIGCMRRIAFANRIENEVVCDLRFFPRR